MVSALVIWDLRWWMSYLARTKKRIALSIYNWEIHSERGSHGNQVQDGCWLYILSTNERQKFSWAQGYSRTGIRTWKYLSPNQCGRLLLIPWEEFWYLFRSWRFPLSDSQMAVSRHPNKAIAGKESPIMKTFWFLGSSGSTQRLWKTCCNQLPCLPSCWYQMVDLVIITLTWNTTVVWKWHMHNWKHYAETTVSTCI